MVTLSRCMEFLAQAAEHLRLVNLRCNHPLLIRAEASAESF